MEKVTDSPLGLKFLRQSQELTAIEAKLDRGSLPPNRVEALKGQRIVAAAALNRTMTAISGPTWATSPPVVSLLLWQEPFQAC